MTDLDHLHTDTPAVDRDIDDLDGADGRLTGAEFERCRFRRGDLSGAQLVGCTFVECAFEDVNLAVAVLTDSAFGGCSFERCKLTGIDWTVAHWPEVAFHDPPSFARCALDQAVFTGVTLKRARFVECRMTEADLSDCDLSDAALTGCDLAGARLARVDLTGADLTGSTGYHIDVRTCRIDGAVFDLPEAVALLEALPIELRGP